MFEQFIGHPERRSPHGIHKKVKLFFHAMKAYRGNRGTAPFILHISTRGRRVVKIIVRPLYSPEELNIRY
jgi:hypothetical protein